MTKKRVRPRPEFAAEVKLAEKLREFEYPDLDTKPPAPRFGGGGGGELTIVIAASNASDLSKSKADFICIGRNDEQVIQAVANLLEHGEIVLSEGTFSIEVPSGGEGTAAISLRAGVSIRGKGSVEWNSAGTLLTQPNTNTGPGLGSMLYLRGGTCADLSFFSNGDATSVFIDDNQSRVDRCSFNNSSGDAVVIDEGLNIHDITIEQCYFNLNTGDAIHISDTGGSVPRDIKIIDNHFEWAGNRAIYCGPATDVLLRGNTCRGSNQEAIVLEGASYVTVSDNILQSGDHGISLVGASNCTIVDNIIRNPGVDIANTFDGIILSGDSNRNNIQDNKIVPSSVTNPRYGINVSAATCDDNVVNDNLAVPAADFGTAPFNDDGTGTLGSNFDDGPDTTVNPSNTSQFFQSGVLSVGTGTFKLPFTLTAEIVSVQLAVNASPTGADLIVDINKNGTTVFTTQANRPTVPDGDPDGIGAEAVPDVTAIAEGDYLTVDIDQIGSTNAGSDLTVVIEWRPT